MKQQVEVLLGLPSPGGALVQHAVSMGVPCLISANSIAKRNRYREWIGWRTRLNQLPQDCALDSAGFVAWVRSGGFPWSAESYLDLVAQRDWRWWAQMDACCEPELARDRSRVRLRQAETLRMLARNRRGAQQRSLTAPMPVLQGWEPADYVWHAERALGDEDMVGVGSMCRRHLHGETGLLAVVAALDAALAPSVRLHLFGVKSAGIRALAQHPRLASVDSMAWDYQARKLAHKGRFSNSNAHRCKIMSAWYQAQLKHLDEAPPLSPHTLPLLIEPEMDPMTEEYSELIAGGEVELQSAQHYYDWESCWGPDCWELNS